MSIDYSNVLTVGFTIPAAALVKAGVCKVRPGETRTEPRYDPKTGEPLTPVTITSPDTYSWCNTKGQWADGEGFEPPEDWLTELADEIKVQSGQTAFVRFNHVTELVDEEFVGLASDCSTSDFLVIEPDFSRMKRGNLFLNLHKWAQDVGPTLANTLRLVRVPKPVIYSYTEAF